MQLTDDQCRILTLNGQITDLETERNEALKKIELLEAKMALLEEKAKLAGMAVEAFEESSAQSLKDVAAAEGALKAIADIWFVDDNWAGGCELMNEAAISIDRIMLSRFGESHFDLEYEDFCRAENKKVTR